MVDSGTAAHEPWDGAAAGTTFQLEVNTLAGHCLAEIRRAQGSWQLLDVLSRLPAAHPGHRYELLKGEAVLAAGTAIADWAQPVDGKACVTAVVVPRTLEEQGELNAALVQAAGALDVEKVRELLVLGANARAGFPTRMAALHKAVEACGSRPRGGKDGEQGNMEEEDEEEQGRLQAVLGALLTARADIDGVQEHPKRGESSRTCSLHSAVQRGSLGTVRVLLDARASIDAVATKRCYDGLGDAQEYESTALHAATQAGNLPLVALLLERGANVNAVKQDFDQDYLPLRVEVRETALHIAVAGGHQAMVALLVEAGADASIARSRDGEDISLEELCAGKPGMLDVVTPDSSAALLAGSAVGAEVKAALVAIASRRAAG